MPCRWQKPLGPSTKKSRTQLAPNGAFIVTAPDLELWALRGGRVVIRVQDGTGRNAEGFVSVASFADITRRVGIVGRRLFALIAGDETPADVVAILNWIHEEPRRLAPPALHDIHSGSEAHKDDDSDRLVTVAALGSDYAATFTTTKTQGAAEHRNWSRFIEQILAAFRDPRGPFEDRRRGRAGDDDDHDVEPPNNRAESRGEDLTTAESLSFFTKLFDLLTKAGAPSRNVLTAFDLTQYVCDRLRPNQVQAKAWLEQLIRILVNTGVPAERRDDIAAAVLTVSATAPDVRVCRWARGCLLRLGVHFACKPPRADRVRGYQAVLQQQATFAELWPQLRAIRTFPEQVRTYRQAFHDGKPSDGYPDLPKEAHEEWPLLEAALTSSQARDQIFFTNGGACEVCPRCHIKLPSGEISKLRSTGIATAKSCCQKVIIIWQVA